MKDSYILWILILLTCAIAFVGLYIFCIEEIVENIPNNKHLEEMQVDDGQRNKESKEVNR